MILPISQQEPRTSGVVIDPPVPLERYMGAAWDQGREDSIMGSLLNLS